MNAIPDYVTEVEYTHSYFRELSPGLLRLACLSAGMAFPSDRELQYLELGFGQGLSVNIHAAAGRGAFWGNDFNATQAAHAHAFAAASGSGTRLFDDSFAELAARQDLPEFDVIALHGIWTWVSAENRRIIVDLIRRKLRVGGIVYVSFNCLPGWAPAIPLRNLLNLHARTSGADTGLLGKVDEALHFAKSVEEAGALYFARNAAASHRLKSVFNHERNYVAHEYFNDNWAVMYFSDVARSLSEAKLTFAASADLRDHVDVINLSPSAMSILAEINSPVLRETVRDFCVNQHFRRDIFAKGGRILTPVEKADALKAQGFLLAVPRDRVPAKLQTPVGEISLEGEPYRTMLDALADQGHRPQTLGQLAARWEPTALQQVLMAVLILTGAKFLEPTQTPTDEARARCAKLNRYICERARSHKDTGYLASPVTGSGIAVNRFHQIFLLAAEHGLKTPAEQALFTWEILAPQGERIAMNGRALESAEDNVAELTRMASLFAEKNLPILRAAGIA